MNKKSEIGIFNPKDLGASLQEVASEFIQRENSNIESHWFHSEKDADLFFWRDEKKNIIKQQVTYYGQLVEWNVIEGVRTGMLIEDESSQKMSSSPVIQYDFKPQVHSVQQCVELLQFVPGLAEGDRRQIIQNYMTSPRLSDHSPEEILKRYGSHRKPKPSGIDPASPIRNPLKQLFSRLISLYFKKSKD